MNTLIGAALVLGGIVLAWLGTRWEREKPKPKFHTGGPVSHGTVLFPRGLEVVHPPIRVRVGPYDQEQEGGMSAVLAPPKTLPVYSHSPGDEGRTPEIELPVANARLLEADSGVGPFDIVHPYKPQDDVPWWYR